MSHGSHIGALEHEAAARDIADARRLLERLEKQIVARTRALPVYKATLESDGLA